MTGILVKLISNITPRIQCNGLSISRRHNCWWTDVTMGSLDPIFRVIETFTSDHNPNKLNVGAVSYLDDNGKPFVLPSVRMAEERIISKNMDHEYAPFIGAKEFWAPAIELALGVNCQRLQENQVATVQSICGTGALCLGATFLAKFWKGNHEVYVPTPTWRNHIPLFKHAGLKVAKYRYYDPKTCEIGCEGLLEDVAKIPEKSIILLHACAHNPTGSDPTCEQWLEICDIIKRRKLFPFFDMAFQGLASGDVDEDAFYVRFFEAEGVDFCLAQSFSKNMCLYGQRVGTFSLICSSPDEAERTISQLKILIRSMYGNPPIHGARIVTEILNDSKLKAMWLKEIKGMTDRIVGLRAKLKENLIKLGSQRSWDHITNQVGMSCYSCMTPEQTERLTREFSVYLTKEGRISMAGITSKNIEYLAHGMHEVTK